MKRKILIPILIIFICFLASFLYFQLKDYQPILEKPEMEISEEAIPEETKKISCEEFSIIPNEITCQEAVEITLRNYPGEVYFIDRTKAQILIAENQTEEREVWLMKISNFSKPISLPGIERVDEMEVAVDRNNGELNIISYEMSIK